MLQAKTQCEKVQGNLSLEVKKEIETIPNPRFARRPSSMNSFFLAEGVNPQNYMADQSRLQISELQLDKSPTHSTFSCWKIRFKTQVSACSSSSSEVDSVDDLKSSRSLQGILISRIFICWMRGLRLFKTRSSRILTSRNRSVWRNRKLRKRIGSFAEDRSLT